MMPKVKKIDLTKIEIQFEQFKRHRAWVSGYEAGTGKTVPFSHNLAMLHIELGNLISAIKASQK